MSGKSTPTTGPGNWSGLITSVPFVPQATDLLPAGEQMARKKSTLTPVSPSSGADTLRGRGAERTGIARFLHAKAIPEEASNARTANVLFFYFIIEAELGVVGGQQTDDALRSVEVARRAEVPGPQRAFSSRR